MSKEVAEKSIAFDHCLDAAIDKFADQPDSARDVALAAFSACTVAEGELMSASKLQFPQSIEEAKMPRLLEREMTIRAARKPP